MQHAGFVVLGSQRVLVFPFLFQKNSRGPPVSSIWFFAFTTCKTDPRRSFGKRSFVFRAYLRNGNVRVSSDRRSQTKVVNTEVSRTRGNSDVCRWNLISAAFVMKHDRGFSPPFSQRPCTRARRQPSFRFLQPESGPQKRNIGIDIYTREFPDEFSPTAINHVSNVCH